jgi:hypothetical protein
VSSLGIQDGSVRQLVRASRDGLLPTNLAGAVFHHDDVAVVEPRHDVTQLVPPERTLVKPTPTAARPAPINLGE